MGDSMRNRIFLAIATLALGGVATAAQANLVSNGSFETFSNASNSGCSSSQQVVNGGGSSNLTGWTTGDGGIGGLSGSSYTFVLNSSNYGNFTPMTQDNGGCSNIGLKPTITASPDGGNFVAADPAYESSLLYTLSTTVTGLVVGTNYNITFYMGAGQQTGFTGASTDDWVVGLGSTPGTGTSQTSPTISPGAGGAFSGWVSEEISLVAAATTEALWFLGQSTAANGQPPFVLLDGISMTQSSGSSSVPEPPSYAIVMIGLLSLAGVRRAVRARR